MRCPNQCEHNRHKAGCEPSHAPRVKVGKTLPHIALEAHASRAGLVMQAVGHRLGNYETRDHEKAVDPNEASWQHVLIRVVCDDHQYCQRSKPIDVAAIRGGKCLGAPTHG